MSMMLMNTTGLKRAGAEQDIFSTYCLPLKSARPASRCYPWFFWGAPSNEGGKDDSKLFR
jgi:hypothetical protein